MNYTEKNKLMDKLSQIGLMLVFVEFFLYAINYYYTERIDLLDSMPGILNTCGTAFLGISVILYLIAYKKEKHNYIIIATEFLALSFLCPFLVYWYLHGTGILQEYSPKSLWVVILIYYIIRAIYTCVTEYLNSNSRKLKKKIKN